MKKPSKKPAAAAQDAITAMSCAEGTASKRFYLDTAGAVQVRNYDAGWLFTAKAMPVSSLRQLSPLLLLVEKRPDVLLIRGAPLPHVDLTNKVPRRMTHFLTPEIGRRWVMIDFDKIDMPAGMDLKKDTLAAIEHLVHLLPAEFYECSYHYQLSSSAGIGDSRKISAHVWFWLTAYWTDQALKAWAKAINTQAGYKLVDPALFNDVQAHYTAAPTFDNVDNPFPVRSGLVTKCADAVSIKEIVVPHTVLEAQSTGQFEPGPGFEGWLALIGDQPDGMGFRQPILRATASYVSANGKEGTDIEVLYEAVRARVLAADRSAHTDAEIEERASRENIIPGIKGALAKWGDTPSTRRKGRVTEGTAPHFPAGATSDVADAQEKLDQALRSIIKVVA